MLGDATSHVLHPVIFEPGEASDKIATAYTLVKSITLESMDEVDWKAFQQKLLNEVGPVADEPIDIPAANLEDYYKKLAYQQVLGLCYLNFRDQATIKIMLENIDQLMAMIP